MKAFKEWWRKKYPRAEEFSGHEELEVASQEGWREALKEVLKQIETANSEGFCTTYSNPHLVRLNNNIVDWIKEELGEG